MARGLNCKWKQPLGYYFIETTCNSEDLNEIITDCIRKMTEVGLDVRALISDMGSNFVKLSKKLGITKESSSFHIDDRKIYYLFDTPHLMKSIRNILLKYTIEFEGIVHIVMCTKHVKKLIFIAGLEAAWIFIEKLYELEKNRDLKLAAKLTYAHIYPTNFQKMRVKYATQVFSATVVSGC